MRKEKNNIYYSLKAIFCTLIKLVYHPKIIGKENIPESGPVILAGNHKHSYDPLLVIMSTKRIVHFLAKKELFKGLQGKILLKAGLIRVDRNRPNPGVVKKAIHFLQNDGIVGIFPEGTRNKTEEMLLPFKYGAVSIAQKTSAPIIPFAIKGKYKPFANELILEFGQPIHVGDGELEKENNQLKDKILELLKK